MRQLRFLFLLLLTEGCAPSGQGPLIQTVQGPSSPGFSEVWLTHEHILVDFIGADQTSLSDWDRDTVLQAMLPWFDTLKGHGVRYFVDATPNFLGRDVALLEKVASRTGIQILTNTGLYGAVGHKYIPSYAYEKQAVELAAMWIAESRQGIEGTGIKPGFIKISVEDAGTLDAMCEKLVEAAALTHLATGLTIASHTGQARALWPQLDVLEAQGVSPEAFIWVHAQAERDPASYLRAAARGCWISLDGLGWELEDHVEKLDFARRNGILDRVLISHDAGWYDPRKQTQTIQSYSRIFEELLPALRARGFTGEELSQLLSNNPSRAFGIAVRPFVRPAR